MQARVTRMIASVESWIAGSGTFSIRTSPAAYMTVPRTTRSPHHVGRLAVLLVADVLAPGDGAPALVRELHGDVRHQTRRCGAVPVVLAGREEDAVAGPDHLDRRALSLTDAEAL